MSQSKADEARLDKQNEQDEAPPGYEPQGDHLIIDGAPGPSTSSSSPSRPNAPPTTAEMNGGSNRQDPVPSPGTSTGAPAPPPVAAGPEKQQGIPTTQSPFNFPTDAPPCYESTSASSSSAALRKPIAIPQTSADPSSPFLSAFAPALLARGITSPTWLSFLDTTSAFLTAKVSDRAISHAGDIAKSISEVPKNLGKDTWSHTKSVGRHIGTSAKKGNILGAAFGIVGGVISIPVVGATRLVGAAVSLPGTTIAAVARKPRKPRERAAAYAVVANKDWLQKRGLQASVVDTAELCAALREQYGELDVGRLLGDARGGKDLSAAAQMGRLEPFFERVEVGGEEAGLVLGEETLWLVITEIEVVDTVDGGEGPSGSRR